MSNTDHSYDGKTYSGKRLNMDGKSFNNCTFRKCTLTYSGGNPPILQNCKFDNCHWAFGEAAARTLGFLSGLYSGGFDSLVEHTFHEVRKGSKFTDVPTAQPDADSEGLVPGRPKTILGFRPPRILQVPKKRH